MLDKTVVQRMKGLLCAHAVSINTCVQKDVSLANDDLLGDLMEELHQGPSEGMMKPLPIKLKKKGFNATKSVSSHAFYCCIITLILQNFAE